MDSEKPSRTALEPSQSQPPQPMPTKETTPPSDEFRFERSSIEIYSPSINLEPDPVAVRVPRPRSLMVIAKKFPNIDDLESPLPVAPESPAVKIDPHWLETLSKKAHNFSLSRRQHSPECSIYPVPSDIKLCDEDAYNPKVVCIGPYHRSPSNRPNPSYKNMEDYKWHCLYSFISGHNHLDEPHGTRILLEQCLVKMMNHEARIRRYYSKEIQPDSKKLGEMMLLDGCFILHLLLKRDGDLLQLYNSQVLVDRLWIWTLVKYDLLLLENQIPFFVIDELRNMLGTGVDMGVDLVQQALDLFSDVHLPRMKKFSPRTIQSIKFYHLLHLFYLSLLPASSPSLEKLHRVWIPSAMELTEFGVKFKKSEEADSFLDINFSSNGVMQIPPLLIDDHSKSLFRNLIAFEQCYPYTGCHITVYAAFMECIINTPKDVRLLHLNGILINRMSADQDLTHFFSRLCTQIHYAMDRNYLGSLLEDVIKYQENKCNKCRADFVRSYCSNSWAIFAGVVSVLFFVFTVAQTFFTIFPYYMPRN